MKSKPQIVKQILTIAEDLQIAIDALVERGHSEGNEYAPRMRLVAYLKRPSLPKATARTVVK